MIQSLNQNSRSGSSLTQLQRQLLAQFNVMDEDSQRDLICMAEGIARHNPRQRPKLHLVGGRAA